MHQPTLQDVIDELEMLKKREADLVGSHRDTITKIQYMIQSVSEAVLNSNCNKAKADT